MKTSYYIACYTKCKCTPEEYEEEAEKLKALFTQLLTDIYTDIDMLAPTPSVGRLGCDGVR